MKHELNECIAVQGFGYLILDYEWPENKEWGIPAGVSCRILIEDCFKKRIHAGTREEAIEMFRSGSWDAA